MSRPLPPHTKRVTPGCQRLHYEDLHRLAIATKRIDELEHALAMAESQAQEDRERLIEKLVAMSEARSADKARKG